MAGPEDRTEDADDDVEAQADALSGQVLERLTELAENDPDNPLLGYYLADGLLHAGRLETRNNDSSDCWNKDHRRMGIEAWSRLRSTKQIATIAGTTR